MFKKLSKTHVIPPDEQSEGGRSQNAEHFDKGAQAGIYLSEGKASFAYTNELKLLLRNKKPGSRIKYGMTKHFLINTFIILTALGTLTSQISPTFLASKPEFRKLLFITHNKLK